MGRTENDTWDLASSVGATATMVAAGRARATPPQPAPLPLPAQPALPALPALPLRAFPSPRITTALRCCAGRRPHVRE
ncbi:MAG: hypothetical protein K2X56_15325 [Mycobacterium pseudokansasii]|uniref:S-adenosyl-L-methionine-dependent methyltransferase n=1 Tax=Mycobacterium pseudokansasii TaxID=2341080 RepID=A0A498QPA2_9MYCO|nr:hypothetical protein [Mycobacterium pseudokansasii]VAZ90930.1 Putative S-adenosyl-L-methionine-dependent methyltransferase [Mycobacterium pseudokansasii]VAZ91812.1 Putative S-adenosyl-L-methionine-dependent methyltransferase [Mycobacterium pseudokansasii]VBA48343.1 Putative S-adenosyl-L-methionine-dependent methyltransferase [Mycobacterium pseudokansasii]